MISIQRKSDCCGCEACAQKCPKHCITMELDNEGFLYPKINEEHCIECHLCEKTCPVIKKGKPSHPKTVCAAINPDEEIRMDSSSGGVFTYMAEQILKKGGVVFGARFDNGWRVVHDYTENNEELKKFRGSKYVQSRIGDSFVKVRDFLELGRTVLFSGSPCQIRGLKLFLNKEYSNLYTVDFVCHGVPSQKAWIKYLKEITQDKDNKTERSSPDGKNSVLSLSLKAASAIANITFRDKYNYGWEKFCFVVRKKSGSKTRQNSILLSEIHHQNFYFYLFLSRVMERYSCYTCPAKEGTSGSDITLGDYWGFDTDDTITKDNKGISLVLAKSEKGIKLCEGLVISYRTYSHAIERNPMIIRSIQPSKLRNQFYKKIDKHSFKYVSSYLKMRNKCINIINKVLVIKMRT